MADRREREVWFRWVFLLGYLPCHWKGWALVGGSLLGGIALLKLLDWMVASHTPQWVFLPFAALYVGIIINLLVQAVLHTERWSDR